MNNNQVIDYSQRDFRTFWVGAAKSALHAEELAVVKRILTPAPAWFIDIGCGHGRLMESYLRPDRHIVLVDYALNHLQMASEKGCPPNVHFVAANATNLPFRDGTFSGGLCVRLAHHIPDLDRLLHEIQRVSLGGGSLVFSYMNRRNLLRILRHGPTCFRRGHIQITEDIFATHPRYFRRLAAAAGLRISNGIGVGTLHQIREGHPRIDEILESIPLLLWILAGSARAADAALGRLCLALWQFCTLTKTSEGAPPRLSTSMTLDDVLCCPACHAPGLLVVEEEVICGTCARTYRRRGRILDLRV